MGGWVGAAVVKRMGGAGPLNGMDDIEVEAFGRAARLRLEASLCDALLRGVGEFGGKDWQGRVKAATVQLRLAEAEGREEDTVQGRMREARVLVQEGVRKAAVRRALMPLVADQVRQ